MKFRLSAFIPAAPLIAPEPAAYRYWSAAELLGNGKTLAPKLNQIEIEVAGDIWAHSILEVKQ